MAKRRRSSSSSSYGENPAKRYRVSLGRLQMEKLDAELEDKFHDIESLLEGINFYLHFLDKLRFEKSEGGSQTQSYKTMLEKQQYHYLHLGGPAGVKFLRTDSDEEVLQKMLLLCDFCVERCRSIPQTDEFGILRDYDFHRLRTNRSRIEYFRGKILAEIHQMSAALASYDEWL